jgi:hypothetical protein
MNAIERRHLCLFVSVIALSGLAGCAPSNAKFAAQHPVWPVTSTPHIANASSSKPHLAPSGGPHELDVIGLDRDQLETRLGPPSLEVQHSPATETIFREGHCTLSVTLYPDVKARIYRALAYKVVGDAEFTEERHDCFAVFDARLRGEQVVDGSAYTTDHGR